MAVQTRETNLTQPLLMGLLWGAFVSFLIVAGIVLLGRIEKLHYHTYKVVGAYYVSDVEVGNVFASYINESTCLRVAPCNHVLFIPTHQIKKLLLARFPRIAAVHIETAKNVLVITITERQHVAVGCSDDTGVKQCWFIDNTGVSMASAPVFERGVYQEYEIIPPTILPARVTAPWLPAAISQLEKATDTKLTEIEHDHKTISATLLRIGNKEFGLGAPVLKFDSSDIQTEESLGYLSRVMDKMFVMDAFQQKLEQGKQLEYVDLRYEGKIFYKFSE